MSATLNNIQDLCQFLNADIYSNDFRPVSKIKETITEQKNIKNYNTVKSNANISYNIFDCFLLESCLQEKNIALYSPRLVLDPPLTIPSLGGVLRLCSLLL